MNHFLSLLSILFTGKITTTATLIGPDPQNETVPVGGQATFQCKVQSKVKPHIRVSEYNTISFFAKNLHTCI